MSNEPKFVVAESTLTDKYQVTVPAPVRKALGLHKRDKIAYSVHTDGTVLLSRIEEAAEEEEENDPVVEKFLDFLSADMEKNPQRIKPLTAEWMDRALALVDGVDIGNINEPLPNDEEE